MINNMPISRKLAGGFAMLILIFVGVGWLVFSNLGSLMEAGEDKERSLLAAQASSEMLGKVLEQQNAARAYTMLGKEEFVENYRKGIANFNESAASFARFSTLPEQQARLEQLKAAVGRLQKDKLEPAMALARSGNRAEAQQMAGVNLLGEIRPLVAEILKAQDARVQQRIEAEDAAAASARLAMWIGGALALATAVFCGWFLSATVAAPIRALTEVMKRLASGDNRVEVQGTDRGDELGGMSKAVLVFREAAVAKEKADAAKAEADAEQQLVVSTLEQNLGKLAEGDLTADIRAEFSAGYATVKTNYNEAITKLRELIGSVAESAITIRTGSGEIAQASEDLARRTEANAASLEETSAAVAQIDQRLKASAVAAGRTVERADGAIATVSGGREITDEAVQAMTRVSESAKGIDSVIEGLDKIAFQTRVLAMNAAVEAGRAGEAGRGFAVVADLVSALAMRSEEEAARAREQLTATQTDIIAAVGMVEKVDGALANISGDVAEVHTLLNQMAADNQAQSTAITQISVAIGTMDQATQQNAAMVEETSAAARNLNSEVTTLAGQAGRFNVGNGVTAAAAKPKARAAAKPAGGYTSPVKALPIAAMASSGGGDDWASF
jgi:methyl-accepting chemotaxis protein